MVLVMLVVEGGGCCQSHGSKEPTTWVLRWRSVPVSGRYTALLLTSHAAQRRQTGVQLAVEVGGDLGEVLLDLVRGDLDGLDDLLAGVFGPVTAQRPLDLLSEGRPAVSGGGGALYCGGGRQVKYLVFFLETSCFLPSVEQCGTIFRH